MAEKLKNNLVEHEGNSPEFEQAAEKRKEELREVIEQNAEKAKELDAAQASKEALDAATSAEKQLDDKETSKSLEKPATQPKRTKATKKAAFNQEMQEIRTHMSLPSRTFSKLIHIPAIEKVSEGIGSTVARPNALLAGSLSALILTSAVYFWARYVGYPLSGFESIGAFILGWLIGIIFDFTKIMITGKK